MSLLQDKKWAKIAREISSHSERGRGETAGVMWRARLSRTVDWLLSRRLMGEDAHHWFYTEFVARGAPERRYVLYKDRDHTHSSDRMAVEWWAWLHGRRDAVPGAEELARARGREKGLAERVKVLEAEDEKMRLRQFAGGAGVGESTRTRKNKLLEIAMQRVSGAVPSGTAEKAGDRGEVVVKDQEGSGSELNPREEPSGNGENFQPGSWNPAPARQRR